ncbi:MAG: tyrosine-type recombinase/integrase [Bacteroidales bacterium]|nr:tyrosine-type recombinase/integrase [Bacteroidales bacterium]
MLRYKYTVRFYLNTRPNADGSRVLVMSVTWKAQRLRMYLPVSAYLDQWDDAAQLAKPTKQHRNVATINGSVMEYRERVTSYFEKSLLSDKIPTPAQIQALFVSDVPTGEERHEIRAALQSFIESQKIERGWSSATVRRFGVLGNKLAKAGFVYVDELTAEGLQKYQRWLAKKKYTNAYFMKEISVLKWFCRWCLDNDYIKDDGFNKVSPRLRTPPKEVIYLTWDELMQLYYFDYGKYQTLANVRDIFCLCAFTSLRFSDAIRLRWSDIHGDTITITTQKTAESLTIELNKYSRAIVEKRRAAGSPLVLPTISLQKCNDYLKDAAMLAQIDEPMRLASFRGDKREEKEVWKWEVITTHCARRTFVVNALRLGIPAEVVMKWTGHSDYQAMRPYVAIVDELKRSNMALFDNV